MNTVRLHTENLCVGYNRITLIHDIRLELRPGQIMTAHLRSELMTYFDVAA